MLIRNNSRAAGRYIAQGHGLFVWFRCIVGNALNEDGDDHDVMVMTIIIIIIIIIIWSPTHFLPANTRFSAVPIPYRNYNLYELSHTKRYKEPCILKLDIKQRLGS